ncbi:hypothetical protein [Tahibacter caeni]|uniref:hypothetical protein n=1 Tax=Tahibacter caeni TaxID=1453545 RepID=UPI002147C95F|nr:hypothetical protein [Tahibacter caeni]
MRRLHVAGPAAVAAGVLFAATANAQVTIEVHWTAPDGSPKTCQITTGTDGVFGSGQVLSATGRFGPGCPGSEAPPPPQITDGLDANELPSSGTAGATYAVNWSADADACDYAASSFTTPVAGWPTSGDACSGAADCAAPHAVPVILPAPGTYTFTLSCRRNGVAAPAVSQRTVLVPGGGACVAPAGLTRSTLAYVEFNYSGGAGRTTDATQFGSIFGYFDETTPLRGFPGLVNVNQRLFLPRHAYAAMRFTVPATLTPGTAGLFRFEETQPQTVPARMSITISEACGDFSATPAVPLSVGCAVSDMSAGGNLSWIVDGTAPGFCRLERGRTYYLNVIHAGLTAPLNSYCAGTCGNVIQNQISAGSPPWP